MAPAPPPSPGQTDSALSYLNSPLFRSPSCDNATTSTFWFQNQKARPTSCWLPSPPATCSSSRKSQGSGCPALTMAPLLNAHCQQPGPSRHHLSLDARHSFLMVPSPELQLSLMKHPRRPSVHNQESFVQLFGCCPLSPLLQPSSSHHHPGPACSTWLTSSLSAIAHGADLIRVSNAMHSLPYLRIFTPADP